MAATSVVAMSRVRRLKRARSHGADESIANNRVGAQKGIVTPAFGNGVKSMPLIEKDEQPKGSAT